MIKKIGEDCLIIAGTSKISLGALVVALLDSTNKNIILTTTSKKYKGVTKVYIKDRPELSYKILYASQNIENLEELLVIMKNKGIRVAIVNTNDKLFTELVASNDIRTWCTACRDGIYCYLEKLIQSEGIAKQIISFDNDNAMVDEAKNRAKGTNVSVCKAVIHSVCSSAQINDESKSVELVVSDECWIVFPPEAYYMKHIMNYKKHMFARRALMYFTKSQAEFRYWLLTKKIDINTLHTLLSIVAYVEGHKRGLGRDEVAKMRYEEILSKESVWPMLRRTHELLYNLFLRNSADEYGDDIDLHRFRLENFIDGLFASSVETIGRGLDFNSDSWKSKLSDHAQMLKKSENAEVLAILDELEEIL